MQFSYFIILETYCDFGLQLGEFAENFKYLFEVYLFIYLHCSTGIHPITEQESTKNIHITVQNSTKILR